MLKKPSQDQDPAPGVKGGAGPGSPNLGRPAPQDTLPIKEGWGSKMFRWFRELEADSTVQKAVEWVLVIVLGLVFWLLIAATTVV
jgi:hypothetical protein